MQPYEAAKADSAGCREHPSIPARRKKEKERYTCRTRDREIQRQNQTNEQSGHHLELLRLHFTRHAGGN